MEERRKFVRLNTDVDVKWTKVGQVSKKVLDSIATSKDISENGICVIVHGGQIYAGDQLYLEIELPALGGMTPSAEKVIRLEGIVVWVNEFEIVGGRIEKRYDAGIKFLNISGEDKEAIKKFVFTSFHP